jgi:hypothetical protein
MRNIIHRIVINVVLSLFINLKCKNAFWNNCPVKLFEPKECHDQWQSSGLWENVTSWLCSCIKKIEFTAFLFNLNYIILFYIYHVINISLVIVFLIHEIISVWAVFIGYLTPVWSLIWFIGIDHENWRQRLCLWWRHYAAYGLASFCQNNYSLIWVKCVA